MNLSKRIVTMCFIFSTTLALTGCGNNSSTGSTENPTIPKELVSVDTFKAELKRRALFLDKAELGMDRLVTEKSFLILDDVKCSYTVKIKEVIIGLESVGLHKLNREPVVEFENKNPVCVAHTPDIDSEITMLGSVESLLTELSEMPSDIIIEKIGNSKYRFKENDIEKGVYSESVFDLNKPLFLNPVEILIRGTGDNYQSTKVISELH